MMPIQNKKQREGSFDHLVKAFHEQIVELIKKYQFRDRDRILGCGVSVSQCYILETLQMSGDLTMGELAKKMHLSISTVTRVVEQLVRKGYVTRHEKPQDRRIRTIRLTPAGEAVFQRSWQNVFQSEKVILESFPAEHRKMLIEFLKKLNEAVTSWQTCREPQTT